MVSILTDERKCPIKPDRAFFVLGLDDLNYSDANYDEQEFALHSLVWVKQAGVFVERKAIGHAGDVVADDALQRVTLQLGAGSIWQHAWFGPIDIE